MPNPRTSRSWFTHRGRPANRKGRCSHIVTSSTSVESLRQSVPIFDTDVSFSYLPGCHVAERISGIYNRLYNGTPAYFVDDLSRLYEYMLEVGPTVFASLPRFFEKIHAAIVAAKQEPKMSIRKSSKMHSADVFGCSLPAVLRSRLRSHSFSPMPACRFFRRTV